MILVTGTYPPEQCGVADYSYCLINSEEGKKTDWKLVYTKDVSFKGLKEAIKTIKSIDDNSVNIQYPSRGYAATILPHLLCVYLRLFTKIKVSVTFHELTQLGWKGSLFSYLLLLFANKLIFTNEFERNAAIKKLSLVKKKSIVIQIFSNISKSENIYKISDRKYEVGCFGYIRPMKGIEAFIDAIKTIKEKYNRPVNAYILGETLPDLLEYNEQIQKMALGAGITIMSGRPDKEVADILANTKIAYLPYPDGLSERRGSFLAFVRNLALIVSTEGLFVTPTHREYLKVVKEKDAPEVLNSLLSLSGNELDKEQLRVEEFVSNNLPASWDEIVKKYNEFL